jgi:endonuclease G
MKKLFILLFTLNLIACDKVIDKGVIQICYDYSVNGPKGVSYTLTKDTVNLKNIKKRPRFYSEKNLKNRYKVKYSDYTYAIGTQDCKIYRDCQQISYDRGHLAPDADFDYDQKTLNKVYTMANIIPQISIVNRKTWTKVEKYERLLATKLGKIEVYTGVIYDNKNNYLTKKPIELINTKKWSPKKVIKYKKYFQKNKEKLEKKRIVIPTAFFKIYKGENFKKCFLYKNKPVDLKTDKLKSHLIECSLLNKYL